LPGAYALALEEMAEQDGRVCAVINDSLSSAKLKNYKARFPERFINVGITEQNMVGVGCGLANSGMIPCVCAASCFMTARAMEQIKVDLGYSKTNVRLCGMSPPSMAIERRKSLYAGWTEAVGRTRSSREGMA
jgi:transketolase